MNDPYCVFCKIVKGEAPSFIFWEDEGHLAFLNIFPNTPGTSLVVPKAHHSSYFAELSDEVLNSLMKATQKVALLLDEKFEDVGRTGLVFEGFGVDHIHSKLYPMHGTVLDGWRNIESERDEFYETYPGFISSHSSKRADDEELEKIAKMLRS